MDPEIISKLRDVKQESATDILPTEGMPIPDDVKPLFTTCIWPNSQGARAGELCGLKAFNGNVYCTAHQVCELRSAKKEGRKAKVIADEEPDLEVKDNIPIISVKKAKKDRIVQLPEPDMELTSKIRSISDYKDTSSFTNQYMRTNSQVTPPPTPMLPLALPPRQANVTNAEILAVMKEFLVVMGRLTEILVK